MPVCTKGALSPEMASGRPSTQGLTLFHFSAQHKPFRSHLHVSLCLVDRV